MPKGKEKDRTVNQSGAGKFENTGFPKHKSTVNSFPEIPVPRRFHHSFVVPWQMASKEDLH